MIGHNKEGGLQRDKRKAYEKMKKINIVGETEMNLKSVILLGSHIFHTLEIALLSLTVCAGWHVFKYCLFMSRLSKVNSVNA